MSELAKADIRIKMATFMMESGKDYCPMALEYSTLSKLGIDTKGIESMVLWKVEENIFVRMEIY